MSGLFGGDIPKVKNDKSRIVTETGTAQEIDTEAEKMNKRLAASLLTKDWGTAPVLKKTLGGA